MSKPVLEWEFQTLGQAKGPCVHSPTSAVHRAGHPQPGMARGAQGPCWERGSSRWGLLYLGLLCVLHPSLYCVCRKAPKLESRLGKTPRTVPCL